MTKIATPATPTREVSTTLNWGRGIGDVIVQWLITWEHYNNWWWLCYTKSVIHIIFVWPGVSEYYLHGVYLFVFIPSSRLSSASGVWFLPTSGGQFDCSAEFSAEKDFRKDVCNYKLKMLPKIPQSFGRAIELAPRSDSPWSPDLGIVGVECFM